MTPYRGGKAAAASYTWDDGYARELIDPIATLFDDAGLKATFFVIAGWVNASGRDAIVEASSRGHGIGNHSMNHLDLTDPSLSDEQLVYEIDGAQQLLESWLGHRPLTFAFPYGLSNDRASRVALTSHVATRDTLDGSSYVRWYVDSSTTAEELNAALTATIDLGGWFVSMGHALDGLGWEPLDSTELASHLKFVRNHLDRVWVDTFENVALYVLTRGRVTPVVSDVTPSTLSVTLSPALGPPFGDVPLTVEIPLVDRRANVRALSGTEQVPIVKTARSVLIDVLPGETVQLIAE